jgi:uncharacterized protein YjbJ (UPF0337 family)
MHVKAVLAPALAALVLTAGCGESGEDQALADVCAARDSITKQVDELASLTITTATTQKVSQGLEAIRDDVSTIRDSMGELADDRRAEVQAANDEFAGAVRQTVRELGTTVSAEDASSQIKGAVDELKSSYRSAFGQLDCS